MTLDLRQRGFSYILITQHGKSLPKNLKSLAEEE
jgi:hypothetical protein